MIASALLALGASVPTTPHQPMSTYEPTTQKFLDALAAQNNPPLYTLSYADARQVLRGAAGHAPAPAAEVEDLLWPVGPTGEVEVRIVRPEGASGKLPAVLYTHGGGWVLGDKDTHLRFVKEIAVGANVTVVFVNYTPAPEAKYQIQSEQSYAALEYIAKNGATLGIDPEKLAIVGDSAGGNMAAVVAIMAKDRKGPKLTAQALLYPVTDYWSDKGSYHEYAAGPWLSQKAMQWFFDAYLPNPALQNEITVAPVRATPEQLASLPEALVITDENDVLRDEGEAYAQKLYAAGVRTTSLRFNGTFHDFAIIDGLADTPAVRGAVDAVVGFLKRKFGE